jgi:CelD/BcsL family acetyltransferase involved in cellulose biosynthesis
MPTLASSAAPALTREVEQPSATVYEIDPLADSRWKALVESHPRASVFHSPNWLRALRDVYGYEFAAITTNSPAGPLTNGIVLCRVRSWLTGSRLVSLPFSDHCEPLVHNSEEFDHLLNSTRRYVDSGQYKYVEIRPVSFEPGASTNFGNRLTYCFHRLDLNSSPNEIFRHFHKDCVQRKIRRAEREKLRYEEGTSEELLNQFYRLMVLTRRRQSLPPQPFAWFQGLVAAFGNSLKIRVVYAGDTPVASILTLSHKRTMTYKYGCSDTTFNNLGGMALLFWKAIQDAKAAGCQELDLGRSDSENLGLIAFKDHWGAAASALTYWKYPQSPARRPDLWQHKMIKQLVPSAPAILLKTVGRLLYKHIG